MYFTTSALFFSLALTVWQAAALVVKRGSFELLLTRQTSSCSTICASFQTALSACTTAACLCSTTTENNIQQCVNCAVDGSDTDPAVLTAAEQLASAFEQVCGSFPVPKVTLNTVGGGPTTATSVPPASSTIPSSAGVLSTLTSVPTAGVTKTEVTTTITSIAAPFSIPTTIQQVTIGPSADSGASTTATSPSTSSSGTVTFGGLTSGASRKTFANSVLLMMCGVVGIVLGI